MYKKRGTYKNCPICGDSFYVTPSKNTTFCSKKCSGESKRRFYKDHSKKIELVCKECGNKFKSYVFRDMCFCSSACYHAWRKHPDYTWTKAGRKRSVLVKVCKVCLKEFRTKRIHQKFCSRDCFTGSVFNKSKPQVRNGRWAINFDACVRCGRTKIKHHQRGLCNNCSAVLKERRKRGIFGRECAVCGEVRSVDKAHILPKAKFKAFSSDDWNHLFLCATHHRCFDNNELYDSEFSKIREVVNTAFTQGAAENDGVRFVIPEFLGK